VGPDGLGLAGEERRGGPWKGRGRNGRCRLASCVGVVIGEVSSGRQGRHSKDGLEITGRHVVARLAEGMGRYGRPGKALG